MSNMDDLLSTKIEEVPYKFASIGVTAQGVRFLYLADRTMAIPSLPERTLAKGVFYSGRKEMSRKTLSTFGGRHFE